MSGNQPFALEESLVVHKGCARIFTFTLVSAESQAPVNLTGMSITFSLRESYESESTDPYPKNAKL